MASKTLRSGCRGRRLRVIVGGRWRCTHSHSALDKSEGYMMLMHESIRSRMRFYITKHAHRPLFAPSPKLARGFLEHVGVLVCYGLWYPALHEEYETLGLKDVRVDHRSSG